MQTVNKERYKNSNFRVDYYEYIQSNAWQEKRKNLLKACCDNCGCKPMSVMEFLRRRPHCIEKEQIVLLKEERFCRRLELHHISYDNLGNEDEKDVRTLCHTCHMIVHNKLPAQIIKEPIIMEEEFGDGIFPNYVFEDEGVGDEEIYEE